MWIFSKNENEQPECEHKDVEVMFYHPVTLDAVEGVCLDCGEDVVASIKWLTK